MVEVVVGVVVGLRWWSSVVTGVCSDADLEAFSCNPADDSFVVLAFQLATLITCLNEVFLSY